MSTRQGVLASQHILGGGVGQVPWRGGLGTVQAPPWGRQPPSSLSDALCSRTLSPIWFLSPQVFCSENAIEGRLTKTIRAARSFFPRCLIIESVQCWVGGAWNHPGVTSTTTARPLLHKGPEKRKKEPGAWFQGGWEEAHRDLGVSWLIGDRMPVQRETAALSSGGAPPMWPQSVRENPLQLFHPLPLERSTHSGDRLQMGSAFRTTGIHPLA